MNTKINSSIRDLIRPIFRQKFVIIITIVIIITGVFWGLKFRTPVYQARVLMRIKGIGQTIAETIRGIGPSRVHFTQMTIVTSNPVLKPIVLALELHKRPIDYEKQFCHPFKKSFIDFRLQKQKKKISALKEKEREKLLIWLATKKLRSNIETRLRPHTDIFEILVNDYDPEQALLIANAISFSFVIFDLKQQFGELTSKYGNLHPSVMQLRSDIRRMSRRLSKKKLSELATVGSASVKTLEQATTNFEPIGKPKSFTLFVSLFVSIFVGIALALGFDFLNQTFKLPSDIEKFLDIPILGSIPKKSLFDKPLIKDIKPNTPFFESYSNLSLQLNTILENKKLKTIMVASYMKPIKNSTIVANLGYLLSTQFGKKTLVIDSNLEDPTLHQVMNLENSLGFSDLLKENYSKNYENVIIKLDTNLHFLPLGQNHSNLLSTLLKSQSISSTLIAFKDIYDVVLFNSSNIQQFRSVIALSAQVDGVILLVNEGKDRIQTMQSTVNHFKRNNINLVGGILNNKVNAIPKLLYDRI